MNGKIIAPCRLDPDRWFPEGVAGSAARRQMEEAASICRSLCSIRARCLGLAMQSEDGEGPGARYGVYGGLAPAQRHELATRRHAAATPNGDPR